MMLSYFTESLADLTKRPQNVIVFEDENATLECSTDSTRGSSAIDWKYDRHIVAFPPCQSLDSTFIITSSDSQTDCNIIVLAGADRGISGPYECSDEPFNINAVAMVIVLGK